MTTHTIQIEGLPECWEPVAYRTPTYEEKYLAPDGLVETCRCVMYVPHLIVQKSKPSRIVLEATEEWADIRQEQFISDNLIIHSNKIWRVKEE